MGVQKKILRRTMTFNLPDGTKFQAGTGALIGGIPGKIFSVAYGPVVHGVSLPSTGENDVTTYEIGSLLDGQGVIINAPEYALVGGLKPSLAVKAGTVVSVMTAGQVWVTMTNAEAILAKMNGYIVFETDAAPFDDSDASDASDDDPLCVIEVNGFKASA